MRCTKHSRATSMSAYIWACIQSAPALARRMRVTPRSLLARAPNDGCALLAEDEVKHTPVLARRRAHARSALTTNVRASHDRHALPPALSVAAASTSSTSGPALSSSSRMLAISALRARSSSAPTPPPSRARAAQISTSRRFWLASSHAHARQMTISRPSCATSSRRASRSAT